MINVPFTLEENVKQYCGSFAIAAPRKGRISATIGVGLVFILLLGGSGALLMRMLLDEIIAADYFGISILLVGTVIFGIMFYKFFKDLIMTTEVLLLPEDQKIVIRRERNKKVVSEHSIDDIEVKIEKVYHEDPGRSPMRWFTLFDTNRQKQIFAVRTAGDCGEAYDTAELRDFFWEVMEKKR